VSANPEANVKRLRHPKRIYAALLFAVALAAIPLTGAIQEAFSQAGFFFTGVLQPGNPAVPSLSSSTDTAAGIYFGTGRTGIAKHLETGGGTPPTLAACGAGTLASGSTDVAGTVTMTGVTACTVTFGTAYTAAPNCLLFDQTTNRATLTGVATTTTLPITGATAADVVSYFCPARTGG
jgi:hypothetical protein